MIATSRLLSYKQMKNILNILFLGGAKRVSLAERFISAGNQLGFHVNLFSYEIEKCVPFASVGKIIIGKLWSDNNVYFDLKKIIDEMHISLVIANVDPATIVLANLCKMFPELGIIATDLDTCKLFIDKQVVYEKCLQYGVPTIPLSKDNFPIFAKPKKGSASKGTFLIKNNAEKNHILSIINENDYIFQEFIDGTEYTVDAYISKKGEYIGAVPRVRNDVTSGESTTATIIEDDEIIDKAKYIFSVFDLFGPITLQFIRKEKDLYFLEINPRFGGGVIASIEAGFDIPKLMLQDYLGENIKPQKNYKRLIMTRCYREVFHAVDN